MIKKFLGILIVVCVLLGFVLRGNFRDAVEAVTKPSVSKAVVNLDVPFLPQAPAANWDLPYQEACEEASVLLLDAFLKGTSVTPKSADAEILNIVAWEKKHFGFYEHTTAKDTAEILRKYFGYKNVKVRYDFTIEDMKNELMKGHPLIVPFAGRMLKNPYYHRPGPIYHMLVVKGFTWDGRFITNDVGTKRGANFVYDPEILWNAIHDAPESGSAWKNSKPEEYIATGRKAYIVVSQLR